MKRIHEFCTSCGLNVEFHYIKSIDFYNVLYNIEIMVTYIFNIKFLIRLYTIFNVLYKIF